MKVLKFGGTSVGKIDGLQNLKKIAESQDTSAIIVVSALTKVTDKLLEATQLAKDGNEDYKQVFNEIVEAHRMLTNDVMPDESMRMDVMQKVEKLLNELANVLHGVCLIKDVTPKISDIILSYGERCSSVLVGALIEGAVVKDARDFIKTEKKGDKVTVNYGVTNPLIRQTFADAKGIYVVPGFIASDAETGVTTTLGRGGSDYTAALIAAALNADSLEIWTDVDGFMTADPKIVASAYSIKSLSYNEAMELCNFGAKVVYPPTIYPVRRKNIPIYIRNTFHPEFSGSIITDEAHCSEQVVRGLSAIKDTSIVNVSGMAMVGVIGVNRRIFSTLAAGGISVFMVAQTASETSTSICMTYDDAVLACRLLDEEFAKEIETGAMNPMQHISGLATIAIVGDHMKYSQNLAGKLFNALGCNGINVLAMAQGASETNVSVIIEQQHLQKAASVIHDSFFLSDFQVLNIFLCGVGAVGSSLLGQLQDQKELLMHQRHLKLNLVGIANSKSVILNPEGIVITDLKKQMADAEACSSEELCDKIIGLNLYNAVFVDCTASADVAAMYEKLITHNISIVAANKIAASQPYGDYKRLKQTALNHGVKYLYETNVGAGLPIIKTIDDLCASGDDVLEIQAVLSGTLNFLFNELSAEHPLSEVIKMAREAHISEPDPRIDLSGKDVLRKLVILIREAGYAINQENVDLKTFIPASYFEGSVDHFMESVKVLDAEFDELRKKTQDQGKRLRFIAKWVDGKATISLCEVDSDSPFYNLEGSNNVVLITTKRYHESPMIIQGYGAGADVTAAGVFADIMRVANI